MKFLYYILFITSNIACSINTQQRPIFPAYSEKSNIATQSRPVVQEPKKRLSLRQRRLDPERRRRSQVRLRKALKWTGFILAGITTVTAIGFGGFVLGMTILFGGVIL